MALAEALWCDAAVTEFIVADGKMDRAQAHARLRAEVDSQDAHGVSYWPFFASDAGADDAESFVEYAACA